MRNLIILAHLFTSLNIFSQSRFGNEWIVPNQSYVKMVIDTKGIYRIEKADLVTAGYDVSSINPKYLQVFYMGKEMAINVVGEADEVFDNSDYIEFYAIGNNGGQDSFLYKPQSARLNPHTSLYSNETSYFLTVSAGSLGRRMGVAPFVDINLVPEPYYISSKLFVYDTDWNWNFNTGGQPTAIQTYLEPHEGKAGTRVYFNKAPFIFSNSVNLSNYKTDNPNEPILIEGQVASKSQSGAGIRIIGYTANSVAMPSFNLNLYETSNFQNTISSLPSDKILNLSFSYASNTSSNPNFEAFAMTYIKIKFPSISVFENNKEYELLPNVLNNSRLKLTGSSIATYGYAKTDIYNQRKIMIESDVPNNETNIYINETLTKQSIWLSTITNKPKSMIVKTFIPIVSSNYNYLIISDLRLGTSATSYKNYRETEPGGGYKVFLTYMDEIYDRFGYGERNPIAIRRFADYMTATGNPQHLFLIGKSISLLNTIKTAPTNDYVPTFGYPGSDVLLTSGLNGFSDRVPAIPTGRLSVATNVEVTNYLNKVIEHEHNRAFGNWQNTFLHLNGPRYMFEYSAFNKYSNQLITRAINSPFLASADSPSAINKPDINDLTDKPVPSTFYDYINNGVGLFNYYGHGATTSASYNFGFVSKEQPSGVGGSRYTNQGKYPLVYFNGCDLADAFKSNQVELASDWVNTPNKGAIAAIGYSYLSYSFYVEPLMDLFYDRLLGSSLKSIPYKYDKTLGKALQETFTDFESNYPLQNNSIDNYYLNATQQQLIMGDPAIKIFHPSFPLGCDVNGKKSAIFQNSISGSGGQIALTNLWNDNATWSCFKIPKETDEVTISDDEEVIIPAGLTVKIKKLNLGANAKVNVENGGKLDVTN